jgi:hypothetical protein
MILIVDLDFVADDFANEVVGGNVGRRGGLHGHGRDEQRDEERLAHASPDGWKRRGEDWLSLGIRVEKLKTHKEL